MGNSVAGSRSTSHSGYRLYGVTWLVLLGITLVMLAVEYFSAPPWIPIGVLLTAMLAKAATIAGNFMHLRYERKGLVLIVALSLAFTAIFLFGYLAADARHILEHPAYLPE
jgi:cytochrome c oxidase subunit IV